MMTHILLTGWKKAVAVARDALENSACDNGLDEEKFRTDLFNIARTTLSSKLLTQHKDFFAQICVDAIMKIKCEFIELHGYFYVYIFSGRKSDT